MRRVSSSTHKQALSALPFFYAKVLGMNLFWMKEIGRPRGHRRLPMVFSRAEVSGILTLLDGEHVCRHGCCTARGCASPRPFGYG